LVTDVRLLDVQRRLSSTREGVVVGDGVRLMRLRTWSTLLDMYAKRLNATNDVIMGLWDLNPNPNTVGHTRKSVW
jgi:hypothetical protein